MDLWFLLFLAVASLAILDTRLARLKEFITYTKLNKLVIGQLLTLQVLLCVLNVSRSLVHRVDIVGQIAILVKFIGFIL